MNIIEKVLPSSLIYPRKILTEAQKQLILKNSINYINCCYTHKNACPVAVIEKMVRMIKHTLKIYTVVHTATTLIFKRKDLRKNPKKIIFRLLKKIFVSVGILMIYGFCTKMSLCYVPKFTEKINTFTALCFCLSGGLVITFESASRTKMMSMTLMSRWLESMVTFCGKRKFSLAVPYFWPLVFAVSWGIICNVYYDDNGMKKMYKRMFDHLLGQCELNCHKKNKSL